MSVKKGPFRVIDNEVTSLVDGAALPPTRNYSCPNYTTCLDLAAALNWDSFTCGDCTGEIDQTLLWRAHQACKKDKVAFKICELPEITKFQQEDEEARPPLVVLKVGGA